MHFVCKEKLGVARRSNGEEKYKYIDGRRKEAEGTEIKSEKDTCVCKCLPPHTYTTYTTYTHTQLSINVGSKLEERPVNQ